LDYLAKNDCLLDMVDFPVGRLQATGIRNELSGMGLKFVAGEKVETYNSGSVDQAEGDTMFHLSVPEMDTLLEML